MSERRGSWPLLGLILERDGTLRRDQVEAIIEEQARRRAAGRPTAFGEIAIDLRLVDPARIVVALRLQARLASPPGAPATLGARLLELGVIAPSLLAAALEEAGDADRGLGALLVGRGWISPYVIEAVLGER